MEITKHESNRNQILDQGYGPIINELYNHIREMIFLHDLDGFFILTNHCFVETVGYSSQELVDKKISDLMLGEGEFELEAYLKQLSSVGYNRGVARLVTKSGTVMVVEYKSVVFERRQNSKCVSVICRDISEQIKIQQAFAENEAELKESEQRFRDIFENINEGIYLHDLEGNFIEVNTYFIQNMGYSKSELLAKNVRDLIPEQYKPEFDNYLRRIKTDGYEKGLFKIETKYGTLHTVEYTNSLVQGPDGPMAVRGVARDVTEQLALQKALKNSQKELTENEQKYRDLFENINAYIFIHDLDGNYIETNAHFFKNMGYSKSEMLTKNIRDLVPPEHEAGYREYLKRIRANGTDEGVLTVVSKDGSLRVAEYTNSLIYGQDGPIAIRGLARDITEEIKARKALKQSENKLKESEKKYRDIFENINAIIYIHELDGRCIEANTHFIKMMGYSIQEIQTKTIGDLIPEDHKPGYEEYLKRIRTNGHDEGILTLVTKNCEKRIVEYTNSLIHGKNGPVAIRGLARDITEEFKARKALKQSENKLRENEKKYRDIFENINAYIYIHDLDGKCIEANTHFIKMIGYSIQELQAKTIGDLTQEKHRPNYEEYLKRIKANGHDEGAFTLVTKNGEKRIVEFISSLIQGEDGPVAIRGLARDITEEFKARKALKASENKLKENEKKFRDIFENINEYIYLTDLEGKLLDMNPHFIKNMGYSKSELQTKSIKDLMPEEYRSEFDNYLKRIKAHGFDKGLLNVITKGGSTRVVHYTNSLVQGENGPIAIRGVARDITEEFKARNALQKSEEELRIARDNLERRVQERTKELQRSNQQLEEKTKSLEEANIALRVLLNKKNEAQQETEEKIVSGIKDLILPVLRKVKLGELTPSQKGYIDLIESNLTQAFTPFAVDINSKFYKLTPAEIQVANLIREGKATKEIARLLSLAASTIHTHRDNIRIKLGIKNRKVNLRTHLIAIQK